MAKPRAASLVLCFLILLTDFVISIEAEARGARRRSFVGGFVGAGSSAPARKVYDENTLQPPQLKRCLITAHQLDEGADALEAQSTRLDSEQNELDTLKTGLQRDTIIAPRSQIEVQYFNTRVDSFNGHLRVHKAAVESYNTNLRTQNASIREFNDNCASRKFFQSDLDGIKSELPFDVTQYAR